jgi:protein-disulfide isomerase
MAIFGCSTPPQSPADIRTEVGRVLAENPDLVLEALSHKEPELMAYLHQASVREQERVREVQWRAELANPLTPTIDDTRPVRGDPHAAITIVEYGDFECQFCAKAARTVEQIVKVHPDTRLIYKHMPLDFHAHATLPALYFEAIGSQNRVAAWAFHDQVFAQQARLPEGEPFLREIAITLAVDQVQLARDVKSEAVRGRVEADGREAAAFGFEGAPAFLVGGIALHGAYPESEFAKVLAFIRKTPRVSMDGVHDRPPVIEKARP